MGTVRKIARLILQYVGGLIFAWGVIYPFVKITSFCLKWYCKVFLPPVPQSPHHAYDDFIGGVGFLFIIFVCIPVGGTLGILMVDKLILKHNKVFLLKTIISLSMGILGSTVIIFWVVLLILKYDVFSGDIRTWFFTGICIPIGATVGILMADKLVLKHNKMFSLQIIVGLLMGICGSAAILCLFGLKVLDWFPKIRQFTFGYESFVITSVFSALIGYNVVELFAHKQKKD